MKKRYEINHENDIFRMEVEIDHDHPNIDDTIIAMVQFWTGWKDLLDDHDGDYTQAFLKQLAVNAYHDAFCNQHNVEGVKSSFENLEGWVPMDGSQGIEIISTFYEDVIEDEFRITKITDVWTSMK